MSAIQRTSVKRQDRMTTMAMRALAELLAHAGGSIDQDIDSLIVFHRLQLPLPGGE